MQKRRKADNVPGLIDKSSVSDLIGMSQWVKHAWILDIRFTLSALARHLR
jgi:hypothetical protein